MGHAATEDYARRDAGERLAPERVDAWADDVRISDIEPRFVCTKCGLRGADLGPDFLPSRMGTGTR